MAAEILESQPEDTTLDALPTDQEAMSPDELSTHLGGADTTAAPQAEQVLPEKYQGKSIQEVVSMHQEAEKLIGSQGSEVGELRKVVDSYINTQLASQHAPPEPEEEVDFFEDPEKAVNRAIEKHPEVVQARQAAQDMQRTTSVQQLQAKHPDMATVLQDPNFQTWAHGSPVRKELFQRADQGYDVNAADELITQFKERAAVAQQAVQHEATVRDHAVKQASTGSATGTNNAGSKRVYRRADIIKLMKNDPDRYEALSPEIMQAYQEGRVR